MRTLYIALDRSLETLEFKACAIAVLKKIISLSKQPRKKEKKILLSKSNHDEGTVSHVFVVKNEFG